MVSSGIKDVVILHSHENGKSLMVVWCMIIDEPTLMTVLGLASLTASAMFLALHAFSRQMLGVRLWAVGCMATGLAMIVDGPRLIDDWQAASLMFNIPFSVGQAFFLAGTMQFCRRPCPGKTLWVLCSIAVGLTIVFTYVIPDSVLRISALSLFQAAVNVWTAIILFKYPDRVARRAFQVAGAASLFQALAALGQAYLVVSSTQSITYAAPELPLANIISWSGATANALLGNWTIFLLVVLRLVGDLRSLAERDVLTGLLNRRGLRLHIDALLRRERRGGEAVGVLLLDIDHFKLVNDTHGHDAGDRVLVAMGKILLTLPDPRAVGCRWGGEEFCILIEQPSAALASASAQALAETVRQRFARDSVASTPLNQAASTSVGIAIATLDDDFDMSALIAAADAQLYRAKTEGRDRIASLASVAG